MARLVRIKVDALGRYSIGDRFRVGWHNGQLLAIYHDEKKCFPLYGTGNLDRKITDSAIMSRAQVIGIEKPNIIVVECNLPPLPDEVLERTGDEHSRADLSAVTAASWLPSKQSTMTEDELYTRLDRLHARIQWIADTEARAAWAKGFGANGELDAERGRLLEQAEAVLDELEKIGGSPRIYPPA